LGLTSKDKINAIISTDVKALLRYKYLRSIWQYKDARAKSKTWENEGHITQKAWADTKHGTTEQASYSVLCPEIKNSTRKGSLLFCTL
jgi:hypothetical protein